MITITALLLALFIGATVFVLFTGIIAMSINGPFYQKYGNLLMRLRVLFQGISVILFLCLLYLSRG